MNEDRKRSKASSLLGGVVLIVFGVLFLLDRSDVADFGDVVRHYWPIIVVGFGLTRIVDGEIWNGLWLLAVGTWLQLVNLNLFGLTYGSSWPLLLIVLGAGMVVRALMSAARSGREEPRHDSR
jgi:uncharacterized membrane protein